MTSPQTRPATPRRHTAWFVWLGVTLLAVSVLGASKGLQSPSPGENVAHPTKSSDLHAGGFGYIDIVGGVTNIFALQPGEVVAVLAQDGDDVEKDAPLFRLDDTMAQNDLDRAKKAVREAELQLRTAQAGIEQHAATLAGQQKVIEAKQGKVKAAEAQLAEAQRLHKAEQIGKEKVQQAEEAVKGFKAEVEAEQQTERRIKAVDPTIAVQRAENDLEEKKLLVKKAQFGFDKCTYKAPRKGKVLRMFAVVGETLSPMAHQPAVQFANADENGNLKLIVRAEIDQEFADLVLPGNRHQTAEIHDDVRSGSPWTGHVERVSDWYTHRRSILQEPLQFNDVRTLEVLIKLDNPPSELRIGQRVRVTLK